MKDFIDKILGAKYTGYVALVAAIIIVIIAIYLISLQYNDNKDVSLDVSSYNENEPTPTTTVKENMEIEVQPSNSAEQNITVEEKVEFLDSLEIFFKGKNVGNAIKYNETEVLDFDKVKLSITDKNTLKTTLDQVISIEFSSFNSVTLKTIKNVKAVIYNKEGKELFNSNVANLYNKVSIGIDNLEESEEYFALLEIETDSEFNTIFYTFKF